MFFKTKNLVTTTIALGAFVSVLSFAAVSQEQAAPANSESSEIEEIEKALAPYVMPESGPFRPDQIEIANKAAIAAWARSAHADARSESFSHWNEDGAIPPNCATCHSGEGFRAFHGLDGSAPGLPENPISTGGVVDCETCHNPGLSAIKEVKLPSGLSHPVAPGEASCITCHQGRAAGVTVATAVGEKDEDTPDKELRFINPHYAVAASMWLGGYAASGYHYPGKEYSGRFFHARPVSTCVSCHEPHTLEVSEQTCMTCHENAALDDIRLSRASFDGSGDVKKGIRADIAANADRLKGLMTAYAAEVAGAPMIYDGHRYPYFFADMNGDGRIDEVDGRAVGYNAWTPRLLKATYNWKFVTADPGAFAHNPHYALELLYDSIEDLAGALGQDMTAWNLQR